MQKRTQCLDCALLFNEPSDPPKGRYRCREHKFGVPHRLLCNHEVCPSYRPRKIKL